MSFAENKQNSLQDLETTLEIESEKLYSGTLLIEIIQILCSEAEQSIQDAFEQGYKAGVAEYKPENTRLLLLNESLKKSLIAEQKAVKIPLWVTPVVASTTFLAGFVIGIVAR